jgi:DNA-binding MarR family transcriptional regulator
MTDTRWLTADEQRAWRAYLESTRVLFDALDRQLQQDAGIPQTYYEILVQLSEAPERSLRMSKLADYTQSSRSRLSHAVDRLVERGWVERVDCPTDKRGQLARMTDDGYAAIVAAAPGHVAAVRRYMIDRLSPQQLATLEQIGLAIVEATPEPQPCGDERA